MLKKDVIVKINEKEYKIKRMNLENVSYLVLKFGSKLLPLLNDFESLQKSFSGVSGESEIADIVSNIDFTSVSKALGLLTREDIKELYEIAFSHVSICSGEVDTQFTQPLIRPNGEYTMEELNYDIKLAVLILVEVVKANVGFFTEKN